MRGPPLDLPLDLEKYHGKFGGASYYRDWMHSKQTDRQPNILLYISLYIDIRSVISSFLLCVSAPIHYESWVMKFHLTCCFPHSMDMSIHTVLPHLKHSTHFFQYPKISCAHTHSSLYIDSRTFDFHNWGGISPNPLATLSVASNLFQSSSR